MSSKDTHTHATMDRTRSGSVHCGRCLQAVMQRESLKTPARKQQSSVAGVSSLYATNGEQTKDQPKQTCGMCEEAPINGPFCSMPSTCEDPQTLLIAPKSESCLDSSCCYDDSKPGTYFCFHPHVPVPPVRVPHTATFHKAVSFSSDFPDSSNPYMAGRINRETSFPTENLLCTRTLMDCFVPPLGKGGGRRNPSVTSRCGSLLPSAFC